MIMLRYEMIVLKAIFYLHKFVTCIRSCILSVRKNSIETTRGKVFI